MSSSLCGITDPYPDDWDKLRVIWLSTFVSILSVDSQFRTLSKLLVDFFLYDEDSATDGAGLSPLTVNQTKHKQ